MEGNQQKMREALEEISSVSLGNFKEPIDGDSSNLYQDARYKGDKFVGVALPAWVAVDWYRKLKAVKEKAEAALSAPPRNCDVGTPEEQATRLDRHCENTTCNKCPARLVPHRKGEYDDRCVLKWAQMPYEAKEGGAE